MQLFAVFSAFGVWMNVDDQRSCYRSTAREFLLVCHHIFHDRITENERHTIEHSKYSFHLFRVGAEGYTIVTDKDYPTRTAFLLIRRLRQGEYLDNIVKSFQKPYHVDCIAKIQHELDETMVIVHRNIDAILEKGEKLDDLVEKSERLSRSSNAFYKTD